MDDLASVVELVREVVLNGKEELLDDADKRWEWEQALERMQARQPFMTDAFCRRTANERFRGDEHHVLMHQQLY